MGSTDTPDVPTPPAPPAEEVDVEASSDLEKSLLKRRKGMKEAFVTKGQQNSLLSKGQLGSKTKEL